MLVVIFAGSLLLLLVVLLHAPEIQRVTNRFHPRTEDLEGRVLLANLLAGWDWAPLGTSTDGTQAANWTQAGTEAMPVHGNPAGGDTLIFSNSFANLNLPNAFPNNDCDLPAQPNQGSFSIQVNGNYSGTIGGSGPMAFGSVNVTPSASPTFNMGGRIWDMGNSTGLTGTIKNGTLSVSGSDTQTWTVVTLRASVTILRGGSVTVTNSILYPIFTGNQGWSFTNDGTLTFAASTQYQSDSATQNGVTKWYEPIQNTANGAILMQAGGVTINSWIDNFGWVRVGSPTQGTTVRVSGFDVNNGNASILGEQSSTTYLAAPAGGSTTLSGGGSYTVYVKTNGRLLIDGAGGSSIAGNAAVVGTKAAAAFLTFLAPSSTDRLSVSGTLTLDYSQTNVNLNFAQTGPTVNRISCTSLTRQDTNTFVVTVTGNAAAIAAPGITTIQAQTVTGNDFQYFILNDTGTWAETWNNGLLQLTRQ